MIAKFMGLIYYDGMGWYLRDYNENTTTHQLKLVIETSLAKNGELKFHDSWSWIMPVVEQIESMGGEEFEFDIFGNCVQLGDDEYVGKTKIEAVYKAVNDFLSKRYLKVKNK